MKNLKKLVFGSIAVLAVAAISFYSNNESKITASVNTQDEITASTVEYASVIDWSDYDFNSTTEAEKCGSGKCGGDKKAEKKKDAKKCGGDNKVDSKKDSKKCGEGKCGGDKAKSEKKSEKKSSKCGTGKCGKA